MDWKDIAGTVGKAAPLLGTLLGGPAGGAVGAIIASALGTGGSADEVAQANSARFRELFVFYPGNDTQTADPTIEAAEGAGNVEPMRGTAYVVFTAVPLADYETLYTTPQASPSDAQDAARYRWLRMNRLWYRAQPIDAHAGMFDETIDSAMKAAK